MIPPTPGPDPSSRFFGQATPPDGAGPLGPDQWWPQPSNITFKDVVHALNPLQHLPGVGMIYREVTGDEIPLPLKVLGAGVLGGPAGMLSTALTGFVMGIIALGPDRSRPPVPYGFSMTGSEAGPQPVTPGTVPQGEYTTLATTEPEFLQNSEQVLTAEWNKTRGQAAYAMASNDGLGFIAGQGMA